MAVASDRSAFETFGQTLSSVPPIVEQILTHLPMKCLNSSAQVCKLWSQTAQIIKRRREKISWMFWLAESNVQGRAKKGPFNDVEALVDEVLAKVACQPKLALLFSTNAFFDNQLMYINVNDNVNSDNSLVEYLVSSLPADCLLLGSSTDGIVGTSFDCNRVVETESRPSFACLLLPHLRNLDLYPFVIKDIEDLNCSRAQETLSDADLSRLTGIPVDTKVQAIVLFCSNDQSGGLPTRLLVHTLYLKNPLLACGGGFVDNLLAPRDMLSQHMYFPHTQGIAFCGDKVRATSVIIKTSVRRKETVESILRQLRGNDVPDENSLAFMFACVGRGEGHYGTTNVEADAFHKLYPTTPLFGFFGNGEIGFASGATPRKNTSVVSREGLPSLFHSYTTIFVLIRILK